MRSGGVSRPPAISDDEDADWGQASNRPPSYWQDSEDVEVELLDNSEDTKRPNGKSTYICKQKCWRSINLSSMQNHLES